MSHRMTFPDARWFADRRPTCDIESLMKRQLQATNDFDYSAKLQKQGVDIYRQMVVKTPVVSVKDDTVGLITINKS